MGEREREGGEEAEGEEEEEEEQEERREGALMLTKWSSCEKQFFPVQDAHVLKDIVVRDCTCVTVYRWNN